MPSLLCKALLVHNEQPVPTVQALLQEWGHLGHLPVSAQLPHFALSWSAGSRQVIPAAQLREGDQIVLVACWASNFS